MYHFHYHGSNQSKRSKSLLPYPTLFWFFESFITLDNTKSFEVIFQNARQFWVILVFFFFFSFLFFWPNWNCYREVLISKVYFVIENFRYFYKKRFFYNVKNIWTFLKAMYSRNTANLLQNRSYLVLINFGKNSWLKISCFWKKKSCSHSALVSKFCVEIPLSSIKFKPWNGTWGNGIHEGHTKYNCSLCQRFMRYDKETKIYNIYKICRDCPIRSHITGIS